MNTLKYNLNGEDIPVIDILDINGSYCLSGWETTIRIKNYAYPNITKQLTVEQFVELSKLIAQVHGKKENK